MQLFLLFIFNFGTFHKYLTTMENSKINVNGFDQKWPLYSAIYSLPIKPLILPKMSKINLVYTDYISIICALVIAFLLSDYTKLKENISNEAKLLNNTQHANQSFIIFNRVPKAGSETLWGLLDRLQYGNNFSSYR